MCDTFSQKAYNRLRELNRLSHSEDFGSDGINILWLSPDFSCFNRNTVNLKIHSHTFYEVHFVLSGSMVYCTDNGEKFEAGENEFIFVPPCMRHRLESKSDKYKKISLTFIHQPDGNARYIFSDKIYKGCGGVWMEQLFSSLSVGLEQNRGTELHIFQNIASLLVLFVADKKITVEREKVAVVPDERFVRAKSFIEDNSIRDISVEEVSAYVYLSSKQLGRLFKENCNMTVAEFIAETRCDRAKKLLEDNTVSVCEIVERMQFSSEQNFNRYFKRVTGLTPGTYRELRGK